jgi:hypothetical protein
MVSAVQSSTPAAADNTGSQTALADNLARCKQKLGDWVACPSGKTPEGKRIIQTLERRITSLEAQMQSRGNAPTTTPQASAPNSIGTLGSLINTFV